MKQLKLNNESNVIVYLKDSYSRIIQLKLII